MATGIEVLPRKTFEPWSRTLNSTKRFWCFTLLTVSASGVGMMGCAPSQSTTVAKVGEVTVASPAVENSAQVDEVASPEPAKQPSLEGNAFDFMNYEFTLPTRFEQAELPENIMPPEMKMGVWKSNEDASDPPGIFVVNCLTDEKYKTEASHDMRQSLVNYIAGTMNSMGIKILGRGATEKSEINGIQFTHFVWVGKRADNKECGGSVYGFLENDRMTTLLHISFESQPDKVMSEMKQHLASFRRKDEVGIP